MMRAKFLIALAIPLLAVLATVTPGQDPPLPVSGEEPAGSGAAADRAGGGTQNKDLQRKTELKDTAQKSAGPTEQVVQPRASPQPGETSKADSRDVPGRRAQEDARPRGMRAVEEERRDPVTGESIETVFSRDSLGAGLGGEADLPRRHFAICIGINDYQPASQFADLQYAAPDAAAMAETLLAKARFQHVLLIADSSATDAVKTKKFTGELIVATDTSASAIQAAMAEFIKKANRFQDVLVFYFAGHGHAEGSAFLVPGDYDPDKGNEISLSGLLEKLMRPTVRPRNKLVILDACRSATNDASGRVMATAFRDSLIRPGQRLTILSGCDASQSSFEDNTLKRGRFTWALLDALSGSGFKAGEEYLMVSHLYEHVLKVFSERKWRSAQEPQQFSSGAVYSLAYRTLPKPAPFSETKWNLLRQNQKQAEEYYQQGRLEDASEAFDYALGAIGQTALVDPAVRPVRSQLLLERALVLYRLGQLDQSRELRQEGIKFAAESPILLELEGCDRADAGDAEKAIASFNRAIDLVGDLDKVDGYLWSRKAALEAGLDHFSAAVVSYGQAALAAKTAGNLRSAIQYYEEMRRLDFKRGWLELARLAGVPQIGVQAAAATESFARRIFGDDHWRTAEAQVLLNAVTRESQLPWPQLKTIMELETLYNRLDNSNRPNEALSLVQLLSSFEASVQGPGHGFVLSSGRLLSRYDAGMHSAADAWAANSFSIIGKKLTRLKRPTEAADFFQRALTGYEARYGELHPNTVRTKIRLAAALSDSGRKAEADQLMQAAKPGLDHLVTILKEENDAESTWDLGNILYFASKYAEAIPFLEAAASGYEAIQKPVEGAWMFGWIGNCYRELKQDELAAKSYESAVLKFRDLKHDNGVAIESGNWARALVRLNRAPEALPLFETSAALHTTMSQPVEAGWMQDALGDALRKLKRSREAIDYYTRAASAFDAAGKKSDLAYVLYDRADAYFDVGEFEQALAQFTAATSACEAAELPIKAAWSVTMQGLCNKRLNRDEPALAKYLAAFDRFQKLQHNEDLVSLQTQTAQILQRLRRYEDALKYFTAAAAGDAARGRPIDVAWDHSQRGSCLQSLNRTEDARRAYQEAVDLLAAQPSLEAKGEYYLGQSLISLERNEEALVHFQAASKAYEKIALPNYAARMFEWTGDCYRNLKRYDQAATSYSEALRRFSLITHNEDNSYLQREYAKSLYRSKRYSDAIPQFVAAVKEYEKTRLPIEASWMFAWLGDCYTALSKDAEAAQSYQESIDRFAKLQHQESIAHVFRDLGDALRRLQRYQDAIPQFNASRTLYISLKKPAEAAWMQDRLAGCYRDLASYQQAIESSAVALAEFQQLENKAGIAELNNDLGIAHFRLDRFEEALRFFQTAIAPYEQTNDPAMAAYQHGWIGDCYRRMGKDDLAVTAYKECVTRFEALKHDDGLGLNSKNLGDALVRQKKATEALPYFQTSAAAFRRLNKPIDVGNALSAHARALYGETRYTEALPIFAEAKLAFHEGAQPVDEGWAESWRGLCYKKLGRDEDAAPVFAWCLQHFQNLKHDSEAFNAEELGQALLRLKRYAEALPALAAGEAAYARLNQASDRANIQFYQGKACALLKRHAEAITHFEKSKVGYTALKSVNDVAWLNDWLGDSYRELKQDERAVAYYREAFEAFVGAKHTDGIATLGDSLGQALYRLKRYQEAVAPFAAAAQANEELKKPLLAAHMVSWQGDCYRDLGQDEKAVAAYLISIPKYRALENLGGVYDDASDLGQALYRLSRYQEAIPYLAEAASAYQAKEKPVDAAWLQNWIGACHREMKDDVQAIAAYETGLAEFTKQQHQTGIADLSSSKAKALYRLKRYAEAIPLFQTCQRLNLELKRPLESAWSADWLGMCYKEAQQDDSAKQAFQASLALFEELKDSAGIAEAASDLAHTLVRQKQLAESIPYFEKSALAYLDTNKPVSAAAMYDWVGGRYRDLKRDAEAAVAYKRGFELYRGAKDNDGIAEEGNDLGQALVRLRRYEEAITPLEASAKAYGELKKPLVAAQTMMWVGDCYRELRRHEESAATYRSSLGVFQELHSTADIAGCGKDLGQALCRLQRFADAVAPFQVAIQAQEELKKADAATEARVLLGQALGGAGQWDQAQAQYDLAIAHFAAGNSRRAAEAGEELGMALLRADRKPEARRYLVAAEQAYRQLNLPEPADRVKAKVTELTPVLAP